MSNSEKINPMGNKMPYVYAMLLLVIIVTIFSFSADVTQNSPEFCSQCHTMKPQYYTWQASSHDKMNCIDCHTVDGLQGTYGFVKDMTRWTYSEITKSYILPIRLFRGIDDEVCFKCHSYNREASVPGNLIIPHESHTDRRVRCVSCHSAVAHGDIAKRAVTRKISTQNWDEDIGLQEMARSLVQTNKAECMACHYRRKVTTDCIACHGEMKVPDYHAVDGFASYHGLEARELLEDCNFCHGWTGPRKMVVDERTKLIEYSRSNRFCISCHRVRPENHGGDEFKFQHGQDIKVGLRSENDCLICHDNNVVDLPIVVEITCSSCHPAMHGKNWRDSHMPKVAYDEHISAKCITCHSSATCLGCHYVPGMNMGGPGAPILDNFDALPQFPGSTDSMM